MSRARVLAIVIAGCALLAFPGGAGARSLRAQRSVAGVRPTLRAYDTALLAGNGKAGCSLLTAAAQKELARVNHVSSCQKVIEVAGHLLKSSPKLAAQVRSYASTVEVTPHGGTATVPKLGGGGVRRLTYSHGLWYLASF
jgi:hypothetical protein